MKNKDEPRIGNPDHWFGDYYLSCGMAGKFILYNDKTMITLKAKKYAEALKEAKIRSKILNK